MAIRKRAHPDRDECIRILAEIDSTIPVKYARKVVEILKKRGVEEMPTMRQIINVRNGRIYDLEVVKALQEISQEKEEGEPKEVQTKIFN